MVTRRLISTLAAAIAAAGVLAYLHDPPWLINQTTGLRGWQRDAGQPPYRWSGAHGSFFVRSDAEKIAFPVSTTFDGKDSRAMMVTVSVDDKVASRVVLSDPSWKRIEVALPPAGRRRVRRIDVRTNVTREDNRGVRIGEIEAVPRR